MDSLLRPAFFIKLRNLHVVLLLCTLLCLGTYGLYQALVVSPIDYQQGEMVKIMYIHVPAAWMSLIIYCFIVICSFVNLVWGTKMSYILSVSAALPGTAFAIITLITGALWGKPIWGTWWVWDARLTSMLILCLLYIGYLILIYSGSNILRAEKPAAVFALIGAINIPIIKFSVNMWHNLHQSASVFKLTGSSSIHITMLKPLLIMFASFILYFIIIVLIRTKVLLQKLCNSRRIR